MKIIIKLKNMSGFFIIKGIASVAISIDDDLAKQVDFEQNGDYDSPTIPLDEIDYLEVFEE